MTPEPKKTRKPVERDEPLNDLKSSDLAPKRRCPAMSRRTGEQCGRYCAPGFRTCRWHGSGNMKSKMAAAKRIAKASGYAADMLVEFMADPDVDVKTRTAIAQDLLDRANVVGKTAIELTVPEWEKRANANVVAAVVDWGELANMPGAQQVIDADLVDDYAPRDATLDISERQDVHREQRMAEVEAEVARLEPLPEPTPPWISEESGAQTATRQADEHRRATFAAEKAGKGLAPLTRRPRR